MDDWFERICPSVRLAGSAAHPAGWVEPRRVIYDHELVLFEEGSFAVEIEGELFDCAPGSFLVVPPMRWHATRLRGASGRRRWVHFSWTPDLRPAPVPFMTYEPGRPVAANARPAPDWIPAGILHGPAPSPRRAVALHGRIEALESGAGMRERAMRRAALLELLAELLFPGRNDASARAAPDLPPVANRVRRELEAFALHAGPLDSIREALRRVGCGYEHAARAFRRTYGSTPIGFVHSFRLETARELLATTSLSVAECGARAGLPNPSYFGRLFRRTFGMSPQEFRSGARPHTHGDADTRTCYTAQRTPQPASPFLPRETFP